MDTPRSRVAVAIGLILLVTFGAGVGCAQTTESGTQAFTLSGDYQGTHEPSVIEAGDTWYVFATGLARKVCLAKIPIGYRIK
jgi:hypothetical protein